MGFTEFYEEGDGATHYSFIIKGFPGGALVRNTPANAGDARDTGFDPWVRKIPWRRKWQPTPVLLPGKSHQESDGLQSMGLQRIRHEWAYTLCYICVQNHVTGCNHRVVDNQYCESSVPSPIKLIIKEKKEDTYIYINNYNIKQKVIRFWIKAKCHKSLEEVIIAPS